MADTPSDILEKKSQDGVPATETIIVSVESVLHEVPKHRLEKLFVIFRDTFSAPLNSKYLNKDSNNTSKPLAIDGCTNHRFTSLLEVTSLNPGITKEELTAALALATELEMQNDRDRIIVHLSHLDTLSPTEKILLGRQFSIPSFLKQGYIALVKSPSAPSIQDIKTIGWDTFGRIIYARESVYSTNHNRVTVATKSLQCTYCPGERVEVYCNTRTHTGMNPENSLDPGWLYADGGWYAPNMGLGKAARQEGSDEMDEKIWGILLLQDEQR